MAYTKSNLETLLHEYKDKITETVGRELTFRHQPAWFYQSVASPYQCQVCLIEENIIYLQETGAVSADDYQQTRLLLHHIISACISQPSLFLICDMSQLRITPETLKEQLQSLQKDFSPYLHHICCLIPAVCYRNQHLLPSGSSLTISPTLQEAVLYCLQQFSDVPETYPSQNHEEASRKELLSMFKKLQEENRQLRQVYEFRLTEALQAIDHLSSTQQPSQEAEENIPSAVTTTSDEKLYRMIAENVQDLIYVLDSSGRIGYVSPSVYLTLGFRPDEIRGMQYTACLHPEDQAVFGPCSLSAANSTTQHEIRIRNKAGNYLWMEVQMKWIQDYPGCGNKVLVSCRNIESIRDVIEKLTESQEQLHATFSSIDDDVYVFDKYHQLISSNISPDTTGFLSYQYDRCLNRSYDVIFTETLADKLKTALSHVAATQEVQQFEHCVPYNAVSLYYKISVNYRRDSRGNYAGFTMVSRDITEEKIADKKIIESEKRYRSVVESVREVIFQTDQQGQWSFLNPAWKEISGHDIFQSLEKPVVDFVHREDKPKVERLIQRILQNQQDHARCEIRFIDSQQKVFWADMLIKAYLDDEGNTAGASGILNDITKRIKAEEILRQSNQLLESINKNIKEALIRVNYQDGLVYFNQAFKEMFGYEDNTEIRHLPLNMLFAQQDDLRTYTRVLREEGSFTNQAILFQKKDGSTFWGLSSFILIQDEEGNEFYDGAIRDITDRREAEKKLQEKNQELIKTNEELDRFVYSASHDLRAPLASSLGLINISRISTDEKERTYYLDLMEQSLNRMDKIIQDLTDYSRNARLEIDTEEIDFEHMIKDVLQRLKYLKNIHDVQISTNITSKDKFYSDKIRLYIILLNLISNAIKYHKYDQPRPYIRINITTSAEKAFIAVTDNGIGIDKSHIDKIFTMFFQVSRDSVGSGLGLYIAKETASKLHGSITVESVVSKGSTFTVTLPNAGSYRYDTEG